MRRIALFVLPFASVLVTSSPAFAQAKGGAAAAPAKQPSNSSAQFTLRRGEAGGASATAARGKARAGDCAGALALFDDALRTTVEPTLYRDRGLCHEKLDHRFPAIDDYRAYLTARPDAPDADQIRERLMRLEGQKASEGESAPPPEPTKDGDGAKAEGSASLSIGSSGASASASTKSEAGSKRSSTIGPSREGDARGYDDYAADEKREDDASESALREGTGWIFGAFVHVPRYFFAKGNTSDMAYGLGGTIRYSTSSTFTFLTEIGYGGMGTKGDATAAGGVLLFGGGELRIPLTKFASDQIVLGGGLGFERQTVAGTRQGGNFWLARFRGGFRHVFGPRVAVELLGDGGPVMFASDLNGVDATFGGVFGGSVALTAAF